MHIVGEEHEGTLDGVKSHTGGNWNSLWGTSLAAMKRRQMEARLFEAWKFKLRSLGFIL